MLLLYSEVVRSVDAGSVVGIMIDFSKAFDVVSRPILHLNFSPLAVSEVVMRWIGSYLDS